MTRRAAALAFGLVLLWASPTQGKGGVVVFGAQIGFVHHIGAVVQGSRLVIDITSKQGGVDLTCPLKATVIFVRMNNDGRVQKRTYRRNAFESQIVVDSTPRGEAILVLQTQSQVHSCGAQISVDVIGTATAIRATGSLDAVSPESSLGDPPPDQPLPLHADGAGRHILP